LLDAVAEPPLDPDKGLLAFPLRRTEASRSTWTYLLGKPSWNERPTRVSVGLADRYGIESEAEVQLRVLPRGWFCFWLALFVGLLGAFGSLAHSSGVLRDGDMAAGGAAKKPWSLGRVQAAWWFFLVIASYLFIGLITGDYSSSITGTVLILLGIAAGTTVSAVVIDRSKDTPEQAALTNAASARLKSEISVLEGAIGNLQAQLAAQPGSLGGNVNALEQALSALTAKQSQLRKLNGESENFALDILSDANGVSFHRFQVAAWTLVLGIIFVVQVFRELAMPQFSETLLGLMGLSAGTFVALKVPEATVPK
jgi:hypothetical protein